MRGSCGNQAWVDSAIAQIPIETRITKAFEVFTIGNTHASGTGVSIADRQLYCTVWSSERQMAETGMRENIIDTGSIVFAG